MCRYNLLSSSVFQKHNGSVFTVPDETRWKATVIYEVMSLILERSMHIKLRVPLQKIRTVSPNLFILSYQLQQSEAIWIGTAFTHSRGWGWIFLISAKTFSFLPLLAKDENCTVTTWNLIGHAVMHWITCTSPWFNLSLILLPFNWMQLEALLLQKTSRKAKHLTSVAL